jgi:hypothetical protein
MPEHHPRPFFLLVKQVEPIADGPMIESVHMKKPPLPGGRTDGGSKT